MSRARARIAMLPNLAGLAGPTAPVGVVLGEWGDLEERLGPEQLARLPESLKDRDAECAICQDRLSESVSEGPDGTKVVVAVDNPELSCGHAFHLECALAWFDRERDMGARVLRCPVCREPFVDSFTDARYELVDGQRQPQPRNLNRAARASANRAHPDYEEARQRGSWKRQGWFRDVEQNGEEDFGWYFPLFTVGLNCDREGRCRRYGIAIPNGVAVLNEERYALTRFRMAIQTSDWPTWYLWQRTLRLDDESPERVSIFTRWMGTAWFRNAAERALRAGVEALWDAGDGVRRAGEGARRASAELLRDLQDARAEGSSWEEVFRALVYGEEPAQLPGEEGAR